MKTRKYNSLILVVLLAVMVTAVAGCTGNQPVQEKETKPDYPTRNIEMVVGWGAGGGTDRFARAIADTLADILGQPVVVVNKPGASGSIAGDYVTKQPADGYTLWAISSNYPLNVALGRTPHKLEEYIPVARLQHDVGTIQVAADKGYATIDDLLNKAKDNPGKITMGGTGAMGFDEIMVKMLEKETDVQFNYVPYEDAGQMRAALLGGHIDAMFEEFGPSISLIKDGSIKVLVAFCEDKVDDFPDVPTTVEKGWAITDGQSRGILVRASTPQEIVTALEQAIDKAKDDPRYKDYEEKSFLHLRPGYLNSKEFTDYLIKNIEGFSTILKAIGA